MSPDASFVQRFLTRAQRRAAWVSTVEDVGVALSIALVPALGLVLVAPTRVLPALLLLGIGSLTVGVVRAQLRRASIPVAIEQRVNCSNLVVTAAELMEHPGHARAYVTDLVVREAARRLQALAPASLFPARRAVTVFVAALGAWTLLVATIGARPALPHLARSIVGIDAPAIAAVEVRVVPPAYINEPATTLKDPARIDALAGSWLELVVHASGSAVTLEAGDSVRELAADGGQRFSGKLLLRESGFIALEPRMADGSTGARRLIGLAVPQDQPPRVRITAPGRDLFLSDATRSIAVALQADDDRALNSLELRYTKVSGSGEQFTFTDGVLPLAIERASPASWTATAALALARLELTPGDMVVYRGVATDQSPGGRASESDAYIVEIAAPGSVPMEGYSADDEEKYALSQQMIVLKTERLLARAPGMPAESLSYESLRLAAEQRSVRAEFVFMMGGELAEEVLQEASIADLNEEAHAEADDELLQGRLASQGRAALLLAIRSMSRANTALTEGDLPRALVAEKAAVTHLQRAFARTRYILRALTLRERLDLSRRLTGTLTDARGARVPERAAPFDARTEALRAVLADIAELSASELDAREAQRQAARIERALVGVDAALALPAARLLNEARTAYGNGQRALAQRLLSQAAVIVNELLRPAVLAAGRPRSLDRARLHGALSDALRRTGNR